MKIYLDTGILLKLYVREENSPEAVRLVQSYGTPICLTEFQQTELRNALHRKCARSEISRAELHKALRHIQSDGDAGVLVSPDLDWKAVFLTACRLTDKHAFSVHCRTLDILHVATVLELGIKALGTTDARQMELARKEKIKILTI